MVTEEEGGEEHITQVKNIKDKEEEDARILRFADYIYDHEYVVNKKLFKAYNF